MIKPAVKRDKKLLLKKIKTKITLLLCNIYREEDMCIKRLVACLRFKHEANRTVLALYRQNIFHTPTYRMSQTRYIP